MILNGAQPSEPVRLTSRWFPRHSIAAYICQISVSEVAAIDRLHSLIVYEACAAVVLGVAQASHDAPGAVSATHRGSHGPLQSLRCCITHKTARNKCVTVNNLVTS